MRCDAKTNSIAVYKHTPRLMFPQPPPWAGIRAALVQNGIIHPSFAAASSSTAFGTDSQKPADQHIDRDEVRPQKDLSMMQAGNGQAF